MAYRDDDPAPLLPASVKAWLQGWLFRALGFVVLLGCAATGASLLSWTAIDPILARATGSAASNLLGAPGAIVADVLMQMTGLAGIFALLPPTFWALHLVTTGRAPGAIRFKVALAPLAVMCMAVALSSLPVLRGSPLHHGYGGLLGDTGLVFVASLLAKINPERSWVAAGLFCFAGGTYALMRSVGLTQQDLKAICRTAPSVRFTGRLRRQVAQWRRSEPLLATPPRDQDPVLREPPRFETPLPRAVEEPPAPRFDRAPRAPDIDVFDSGRGTAFDNFTDRSSEDIARRFAPGGGGASPEPRVSLVDTEPNLDLGPAPAPPAPSARHVDATWVRSSLGPLKRRHPVKGIARPEPQREKLRLCDLLESGAFGGSDATLPIALGRDTSGAPVIEDLARMPNLLLVADALAEKSAGLNAVVLSLVHRHAPEQCRLMLIAAGDRSDLSAYEAMPHLLAAVATEARGGLAALDWIAAEMDDRLRRMARLGVGNIDVFNNRVGRAGSGGDARPLPHIAVVVEELSDLTSIARDRVESAVQRLDKKARAAGIHLVMATQRPSSVTASIKRAFPTRVAFRLASKAASIGVLDVSGAEELSGDGEMLYWSSSDRTMRVRAPFVSHEEIGAIIACLRDQADPRYV